MSEFTTIQISKLNKAWLEPYLERLPDIEDPTLDDVMELLRYSILFYKKYQEHAIAMFKSTGMVPPDNVEIHRLAEEAFNEQTRELRERLMRVAELKGIEAAYSAPKV